MTTVDKSQKAALFVLLSLLATLIAGLVLYFAYSGQLATAVPLLIGCVLVAFALVAASARIISRVRRSRMLAEKHQVPPSKVLHALDLRQWLMLLLGITVIAISTGAFTGVRILTLTGEPEYVAPPPPSLVAQPPATTTPTLESTETVEPIESTEPTESPAPDESASEVPVPEATKYLDTEEPIAGYYQAEGVTFSAKRHTRGITFLCDDATNSVLQWNVAGMNRFSATAGIDDNTDNTFGKVVEFLFYDQDGRKLGKTIEVSVGHPKEIKLDLPGVVSLRMTCAARDAKTNEERNTYSSLGDPFVASD